ncbi:hypothetical protein VTJ49DRAFT_251 [Mycothermus thermophilus]|uniref:Uncharacterized protein n=1 Tax=Humicola insolens TaxID=85995 RepID=A0ABR3VG48_HUMIN
MASDTQRLQHTGQSSAAMDSSPQRSGAPSPQRRYDESWVEVSSQPSSSSLSSIGDDIVTPGFRVSNNSYPPRRRRTQQQQPMPATFIIGHPASQGGATSSQEEYDETESEEDRVLTSSTEAIPPSTTSLFRQQTAMRAPAVVDSDSDDDDDENATALGRPSNTPVFRPQPNAFSHPPSYLSHRHSTGSAPLPYQHPSHSRPSFHSRGHTRSHRGPPDYLSPAYQADNDAALRASLTTLLSCAAAARGLPKHEERCTSAPGVGAGVVPSNQPMELRLVPESELMTDDAPAQQPSAASPRGGGGLNKPPTRTASNSSAPSAPPSSASSRDDRNAEKTKRAAAPQSRPARAAKKKRTSTTAADADAVATAAPFLSSVVSPTLLPWVVSAGLVVLVSVVGFGAGYVIGREVGRQEGAASSVFGLADSASNASSAATTAAGCGGEVVSGWFGSGLVDDAWHYV